MYRKSASFLTISAWRNLRRSGSKMAAISANLGIFIVSSDNLPVYIRQNVGLCALKDFEEGQIGKLQVCWIGYLNYFLCSTCIPLNVPILGSKILINFDILWYSCNIIISFGTWNSPLWIMSWIVCLGVTLRPNSSSSRQN